MTTPRIRVEILTFEHCPNADTAREHVLNALEAEALDAAIVEVAVLRLWPSRRSCSSLDRHRSV